MNNKQAISVNTLANIIMGFKGAKFASMTTTTPVKMNKRNNPFYDKVLKTSTLNVTLGFNYENSVNAQRVREGGEADFVAQPRAWGQRINGTTVVTHNGMLYVECKVNQSPKEVIYTHSDDGRILSKEEIEQYLPTRSKPATQGTDKEIIIRDFKLMNIDVLKTDGTTYVVEK